MLQLATAANETVLKMDAAKAWKSKSWAASEQFVCRDPSHEKKKSVSDLLLARQSLLCYCSGVAASNRTRRSGRLSMTWSLGLGSGCTGWGWRKSQVTNPSFPSAGAVLETALAQICHEGFSMTVANADICPADQSQDMWALVQTESSTLFAHLPRTETWWQQVWQEKTLRPLLDGLTSIKHKVTHAKHVAAMKFNFRREAASKNRVIIWEIWGEHATSPLTASSEYSSSGWFQEQCAIKTN